MPLLGPFSGAFSRGQRAVGLTLAQLTAGAALQLRGFVGAESRLTTDRQDALDLGVWARNNMYADQFADASGCGSPGISCRFDRADIAAHKHRHISGADVFLTQQLHVGCFDHRIGRFYSADKAFGLDHSECFKSHLCQSSLFKIVEVKNKAVWFLRKTQATTLRDKNQDSSNANSLKFDNDLIGVYSAAKERLAGACWLYVGWMRDYSGSCSTLPSDRLCLRPARVKMAESIGEKLRLARETQGIALRDISEQTRISMRYLEAIEANDYKRLPGGIFNRSFIRAYAKFIGYDEDQAIEEYARTLRELGAPEEESKSYKSLVYTDDGAHNRSPLMTLLLALVILAVLSLCVWAGLHFYQRSFAPKTRTGQRYAPAMSFGQGTETPQTMEGNYESIV
jgi:transcriptional regulator with XRE-family HTH domain